MSKKPDIKLAPAPVNTTPRNFWNTCPRKLDMLPETPCDRGKQGALHDNENISCGGCPWAIKSAKANFCFWKWVQDNSAPDGHMDPCKQDEVAELLNCSSTRIHLTCKDALKSIKKGPLAHVLAELNTGTQSDPDDDSNFLNVASQIQHNSDDEY